jgi:hypothetical protein
VTPADIQAAAIYFPTIASEVNGCVRKMLAADLEIVAVVELVHRRKVCVGKLAALILR